MNSDGESLLWAYNRLVRQEAPRKVLIVLSDGQPCACGGSTEQAANYLKFVASNIEAGPVELYGVGVETNAVKDFYSDYCVINDADELESTLLEIVKKKVVR
jgi:cobalamin biosynthesis protein CobT